MATPNDDQDCKQYLFIWQHFIIYYLNSLRLKFRLLCSKNVPEIKYGICGIFTVY